MKIIRNITTPTGNILIGEGEKGLLEFLSLADYGKAKNIKADFLGLTEEINGVPHGELMSLDKKWVITISTQYGCSMNCTFCDVPKVGPGLNATFMDLIDQLIEASKLHPEITQTERLNIHFARMGEPTFNPSVLDVAISINLYDTGISLVDNSLVHPVVSTMMPKKNRFLKDFLEDWMAIKNTLYRGNAGLQLSINSTNEKEREQMFSGNALDLESISLMVRDFIPEGRKITLNFALAGYTIDARLLARLFDPKRFLCKITPMHITKSCEENSIHTDGGYTAYTPYRPVEEALKEAGFDVIVFVPSIEEDQSRITCGNAILGEI